MSITGRAGAVVLGSVGLLALLSPLQIASADPQQKPAAAKNADKDKAAKGEKKSDDKKDKAQKEEAKTEKAKTEKAKVDQEVKVAQAVAVQVAQPAAAAAPPAPPGTAPTPRNPEDDLTDAITLPTNRKIKQRLELADADYIK